MKLLCDANLGRRLAQKLAEAGHDVVRSIHRIRHDARDEQVLALAAFEDRILITCDSDFGELVFLAGEPPPPAIIYVRFEPDDVEDIAPRILERRLLNLNHPNHRPFVLSLSKDRFFFKQLHATHEGKYGASTSSARTGVGHNRRPLL